MTESPNLPLEADGSEKGEAATGHSTDEVQQDRERLCLERLIELGDHTYGVALENTVLAKHEPDEDVRAKLAAIGTRAGASWVMLYDKEREVRSRLANRGK